MFQISSKAGQKGRSVFQKMGRNTSLLFFCNFILVTHAVPDNCEIYCDARPAERHYIHYIFNMHSQKPFKKNESKPASEEFVFYYFVKYI